MDTSSFFHYPGKTVEPPREAPALLANASADDWRILLSFTQQRRFTAGDLVIQQGDHDDALLLITDGQLEVLLVGKEGKQRRLTMLGAGSVVGEQSFFDQAARSTDIRAITDGSYCRLSRDDYVIFSARHPRLARELLVDLGRIVSQRLRETTRFLALAGK